MVEELFGSDHEFFKIFSSALGGIKLNSKFQTTNPQRASRKSSPNRDDASPDSRRRPTTSSKKRKVLKDTLPSIKQSQDPKSLLSLSTSAQSERLRKPALKIHRNLQKSFLESAQAKRHRLSLMESSLAASYQDYREKKLKEFRPKSTSQNRRRRIQDMQYLRKMRKQSEQKLACTIGPTCSTHDWTSRSPIKKVCKRDPNCPNHDWSRVDMQDSPFQVVCKRGLSCKNHDWADHRSPMHSSDKEAPTSLKIEPQPECRSLEFDSEKFYHMHVEYMRLLQEEQAKTIEMILKAQNEQRQQQMPQNFFVPPPQPVTDVSYFPPSTQCYYGYPPSESQSRSKNKRKKSKGSKRRHDSSDSSSESIEPEIQTQE